MTPTRYTPYHESAAHGAASFCGAGVAGRRYGFVYGFGYWFSTGVPEAMS
ncbi:hypothetical protein SAMN04487955_104197 [Halomonas korlensis]|uniref:Uncharacterized protein n=1 Tax=Halomonas korlensis TaxID=463301 RepID=A0A1I7HEF7_9GAMM|nr:hypothetical protein SAMN04487955_104197 [Halomonas korlensis]